MSVRAVPVPIFAAIAFAGLAQTVPGQEVASVDLASIDSIFAEFDSTSSPGCSLGVARAGESLLQRAWGMADLEHDAANTPQTVFESGSVAKQFTAAAVQLLALDEKLSLDDDIREYVAEMPAYDIPITIRDLLHHTSGLREWSVLANLNGWPRGFRRHTNDDALGMIQRQTALNHSPGEMYSYTNSGYVLLAIIVERVSGMSFAEFSRTRLFEPLGMMQTEWRDDFTRVVSDRAIAYAPTAAAGWLMAMPFEDVVGPGGLLTTVEDLLIWTRNLDTGDVGGTAFVEAMHRQGVLGSGETIAYAAGLNRSEYRGTEEVSHGGATAGYRTFLTRFPEHQLAVAVLCNAANANAEGFARRVVDLFLEGQLADVPNEQLTADAAPAGIELANDELAARAGIFREGLYGRVRPLVAVDGSLRVGPLVFRPESANRFLDPRGAILEFDEDLSAADMTFPGAGTTRLSRVDEFTPSANELEAFTGRYATDEVDEPLDFLIEDEQLVAVVRNVSMPLTPIYTDSFSEPNTGTVVTFFRSPNGSVDALRVGMNRAWDIRYKRIP